MGVSKNRGTQNGWFLMETPIKKDDFGQKPHYFRKHPYEFLVFDLGGPIGYSGVPESLRSFHAWHDAGHFAESDSAWH